ncbi:hypothetical protein NDU88_001445 [Pleurodeles waltl]|uniref:Uncharacterized protein n=1 Tax=Pleurodeles waltl TaxID=8319 RepID=A0AAV7R798_PLEWA|nr:hypothetical protein NDU88_001445 [Pleurodeles waltl]
MRPHGAPAPTLGDHRVHSVRTEHTRRAIHAPTRSTRAHTGRRPRAQRAHRAHSPCNPCAHTELQHQHWATTACTACVQSTLALQSMLPHWATTACTACVQSTLALQSMLPHGAAAPTLGDHSVRTEHTRRAIHAPTRSCSAHTGRPPRAQRAHRARSPCNPCAHRVHSVRTEHARRAIHAPTACTACAQSTLAVQSMYPRRAPAPSCPRAAARTASSLATGGTRTVHQESRCLRVVGGMCVPLTFTYHEAH